MLLRLAIATAFLLVGPLTADARPLLLISTENGPDHVQTTIVRSFVDRVRDCCADRVDVEFHHDGTLYRDRDVLSALAQGKVAMAVAGTWQLDRQAPSVGLFMLPVFYGRTEEEVRRIDDSPVLAELNRELETSLGAVVLGRWVGLGFVHSFAFRKPLNGVDDLKDLRIRSPGGVANAWRLSALGAEPVPIAWTDLPYALADGRVDGLISTFASLDSASLWQRGIRYALEDRQSYSMYVPLVSGYFWRSLTPATQDDLRRAWEAGVEDARALTRASQARARERALAAGISIVVPEPAETARVRARLARDQAVIAGRVGVDEGTVARMTAVLGNAP